MSPRVLRGDHVVVVRINLTDEEWGQLRRSARYHGETVRQVVQTEARLGVQQEIEAVVNGQRQGRKRP